MTEPVKVIMRYANGKLTKGYTNDFFPNIRLYFMFGPLNLDPQIKVKRFM